MFTHLIDGHIPTGSSRSAELTCFSNGCATNTNLSHKYSNGCIASASNQCLSFMLKVLHAGAVNLNVHVCFAVPCTGMTDMALRQSAMRS